MAQSDDKRIPLPFASTLSFRDSTRTKDARNVNGFFEKQGDENNFVKRFGLTSYQALAAGSAQGMFSWNNVLYVVINGTLYKNGVVFGSVNSTGGQYYFVSNYNNSKLMLKNTTNGYYTDGTTLTAISSANYPATTVPGVQYLDGYFVVLTIDNKVVSSSQNDPSTWASTDFLVANIDPSAAVFLGKQLNYLMVLQSQGIEFFYDAGNPSPGSPFGSVPNAFFPIGCASAGSVAALDTSVIWMSQSKSLGRGIMAMSGYQPQKISDQAVEKVLNADALTGVYAYGLKTQGHYFYVLTLTASNVTLVYDFASQSWSEWTSYNGTAENYFSPVMTTLHQNANLLLDISSGVISNADPTVYQDLTQPIYLRSRLDPMDFGTSARKTLSSLDIHGDQVAGSTLQIRWSDDDYKTYSNYATIDMSQLRKYTYRLGQFRRRAFEMLHTANTPFRASRIELDMDVGEL